VSEWEEFTAYRGLIADAKREERERITTLLESEASLNGFAFRDSKVSLSTYLIALIRGES
jgi:hypothetical protein